MKNIQVVKLSPGGSLIQGCGYSNRTILKATDQAFFQLEQPQRPIPAGSSHSHLMGVSGIVPGKIMEWLGTAWGWWLCE